MFKFKTKKQKLEEEQIRQEELQLQELEMEQQKAAAKEKKFTVLCWIFSVFCFLAVLTYGFHFCSIIFLVSGIAALPVPQVRELWEKITAQKGNWIKPLIIGLVFFVGVMNAPATEVEHHETPNTEISTEITDNSSSEDTLVKNTETENNSEIEIEKETTSEVATESEKESEASINEISKAPSVSASQIPEYSGKAYVALNNNYPNFPTDNLSPISFEYYSDLDSLGRCGVVFACIGQDIMPTEERGSIGQVKPTGWHTVKYDIVDGNYLYNRCHLIGYQLTGENANTKNLITGTRQMNMKGMLPLENMVADYVKETGNHVMYKVTPVFEGNNLLAKGVQIEAYSIEDNGAGICFNVFAYNVQDGININYVNGDSSLIETPPSEETKPETAPTPDSSDSTTNNNNSNNDEEMVWIPQSGSKYHNHSGCSNMKNPRQVTKEEAEDMGYEPCKKCY